MCRHTRVICNTVYTLYSVCYFMMYIDIPIMKMNTSDTGRDVTRSAWGAGLVLQLPLEQSVQPWGLREESWSAEENKLCAIFGPRCLWSLGFPGPRELQGLSPSGPEWPAAARFVLVPAGVGAAPARTGTEVSPSLFPGRGW